MSTHSTTVATTPLSAHHSNSATLTQASGAPATLSSSSHHSTSHSQQPPQQQQQHHHHHSSYHHLSYEERLPKLWRPLLSSVANCLTKAEKAAAEPTQTHCKELNDGVVTFLRTRVEWHRLLGNVQAKLQGQAQEREALEGYVRTQPRLGKRKRTTGGSISFPVSVVDEVVAAAGLGDELVVLETAIQQEVVATTTNTSSGIGNDGGPAAAPGVGGPGGGDDFSTDFDGVMVDPIG